MRQYGDLPPWLAALNTPQVSAVTGLGAGGGAGVQTPDSGGFGEVRLLAGSNPSEGGSIDLTFPDTPPALFIAGSEGLGTLGQSTTDNVVTITWDGTPVAGTVQTIHYEWSDPNEANP